MTRDGSQYSDAGMLSDKFGDRLGHKPVDSPIVYL